MSDPTPDPNPILPVRTEHPAGPGLTLVLGRAPQFGDEVPEQYGPAKGDDSCPTCGTQPCECPVSRVVGAVGKRLQTGDVAYEYRSSDGRVLKFGREAVTAMGDLGTAAGKALHDYFSKAGHARGVPSVSDGEIMAVLESLPAGLVTVEPIPPRLDGDPVSLTHHRLVEDGYEKCYRAGEPNPIPEGPLVLHEREGACPPITPGVFDGLMRGMGRGLEAACFGRPKPSCDCPVCSLIHGSADNFPTPPGMPGESLVEGMVPREGECLGCKPHPLDPAIAEAESLLASLKALRERLPG